MEVYDDTGAVTARPGHHRVRLPVTTDLDGHEIGVDMHVLVGDRPGPVLTLLAGVHGNEWGHVEFLHRFVREFEPAAVAGSLRVVPTANARALGALSRAVPDDSDQPDVNRSFPGEGRRFTWLAELIASVLAERVLPGSDAVLEFHVGIWGSAMGSSIVASDYSDQRVQAATWQLAEAFGTRLVFATRAVSAFPGPRSVLGFAGERLGIPTCGSMVGGAGFDRALEAAWRDENLRGIRNVMRHMGMLAEDPAKPTTDFLVYETVHRLNPRSGGLLLPTTIPDTFGRDVRAGERLGVVVSPYSLDVIEELEAPFDGYLAYWARDYPVHPGDWAFGIVPRVDPGTRTLSRLG